MKFLRDREHLVGLGGELLPIEYTAGQSWPVRVIEGVRSPIPMRAGGVRDFGGCPGGRFGGLRSVAAFQGPPCPLESTPVLEVR